MVSDCEAARHPAQVCTEFYDTENGGYAPIVTDAAACMNSGFRAGYSQSMLR